MTAVDSRDTPAVAMTTTPRHLLMRFLAGEGVEIGPGHHPMPLPLPGVTVRYVDRWVPDEQRALFPELGKGAAFPQPDIVANLDTDRLAPIPDRSQDFVIASHVLEHVAEPLGLLADIHRVLRPGGVLLLLLPDRRYTFDAGRDPTPLEHLLAEHAAGTTEADDAHLEEYLRNTDQLDPRWTHEDRVRMYALHRQRSIHVHCWAQHEFVPVLEYAARAMGMDWDLLDATFTEEAGDGFEFGMALGRGVEPLSGNDRAARLGASWGALHARAVALAEVQQQTDARLEAEQARDSALARVAELERRFERLRRLPGFTLARAAWRRWAPPRPG